MDIKAQQEDDEIDSVIHRNGKRNRGCDMCDSAATGETESAVGECNQQRRSRTPLLVLSLRSSTTPRRLLSHPPQA